MATKSQRRDEGFAERRRLLDQQKAFANSMLRRYLPLEQSLMAEVRAVVDKIRILRSQGLEPGTALEIERKRIADLLESTREQIQRWTNIEMLKLDEVGSMVAESAITAAVKQVRLAGAFGQQNPAALEKIAKKYETVPLTRRYGTAGAEAKEAVKQALFETVGKGENPRTINRAVQDALGATRDHADTIARTWIIDAHRGAGLDYYRSQGARIGGWEWLCAKNLRTCPVCLAMDGTKHRKEDPFATHPRCRCTHIPLLDDEFEEERLQTGEEFYQSLTYAEQRNMVGPVKARLIHDGKLKLADLVDDYVDPDYGPGRKEKTLKKLIDEGTISRGDMSAAWAAKNSTPENPPIWAQEAVSPFAGYSFNPVVLDDWTYTAKYGWDSEKAKALIIKDAESLEVTGSEKRSLSAYKRTGVPEEIRDDIVAGNITRNIQNLDSVLDRSAVSSDMVLYRGIALNQEVDIGDDWTNIGFASTSLSLEVAKRFSGVYKGVGNIIEFEIPKGYKAIPLDGITNPKTGGEYEYLLGRGTKFTVVKKEVITWTQRVHDFENGGMKTLTHTANKITVRPQSDIPIEAELPNSGIKVLEPPKEKTDWDLRRERLYSATPDIVTEGKYREDAEKILKDLFPDGRRTEEIVDMFAFPGDPEVKVFLSSGEDVMGEGTVGIAARDPKLYSFLMARSLSRQEGKLVVHHDAFEVETREIVQKGDGAVIFAESVDRYRKAGISEIRTRATGSDELPGYNGYYTWAVLGFDGRLPSKVILKYHKEFGKVVRRVQEVLDNPKAGPDWWKKNGASFDGVFDLTPGSKSLQVLEAYKAAKNRSSKPNTKASLSEPIEALVNLKEGVNLDKINEVIKKNIKGDFKSKYVIDNGRTTNYCFESGNVGMAVYVNRDGLVEGIYVSKKTGSNFTTIKDWTPKSPVTLESLGLTLGDVPKPVIVPKPIVKPQPPPKPAPKPTINPTEPPKPSPAVNPKPKPAESEYTSRPSKGPTLSSIVDISRVEPKLRVHAAKAIELIDNLFDIGDIVKQTGNRVTIAPGVAAGAEGTFTPSLRKEKLISLKAEKQFPVHYTRTAVHELSHFIDNAIYCKRGTDGAWNEFETSAPIGKSTKEASALRKAFQETNVFQRWKRADSKLGERYYTDPLEMFARYSEQYVAHENGVKYRGQGVASSTETTIHFQRDEYEAIKPFYEAFLESNGIKLRKK